MAYTLEEENEFYSNAKNAFGNAWFSKYVMHLSLFNGRMVLSELSYSL